MVKNEKGYDEMMLVMGVIRGFRHIGDKRKDVKIDRPVIMTRNPEKINKILEWNKNDIIFVKGAITTRPRLKPSICPFCKTRNEKEGLVTYIEPIFIEKEFTSADDNSSIQYLNSIREISNQARVAGNLCRDPKKITVKNGPQVTQYPLAVERKFIIAEDPPDLTTDFPWVKVYGTNALDDRNRLKLGSEVFIDGLLQTRTYNQKSVCINCNKLYEWKDRALEIVPYETEYVNNYYSVEEAAELEIQRKNDRIKALGLDKWMNGETDIEDYDNDEITQEDIEAGFDAYEETEE